MAEFCRHRRRPIGRLALLLAAISLVGLCAVSGRAQSLYDRPVLIVDPGMHTARTDSVSVDGASRFFASGSDDKTVRIWSASDGKLLRTIRVPAGPGAIGQIYAVALSPDGNLVAAGGYGEDDNGATAIYLFDRDTGRMARRIVVLGSVNGLSFSVDGRYLAVTEAAHLQIFDRDTNMAEAFRDHYGDQSYGASFNKDGWLATASFDGKVRLYDPSFKLVATQDSLSGRWPLEVAFSPDGRTLAVGQESNPAVDLLDGRNLTRLPGPDVDGLSDGRLDSVAWSPDGETLFASGAVEVGGSRAVLAWDHAGKGKRRAIAAKCVGRDDATVGMAPLASDRLLVAKANPCLIMMKSDGEVLWTHAPPGADFRNEDEHFAVSTDGMTVDFGFEAGGASALRFDVRALKLSDQWPADHLTSPPKREGLKIENWHASSSPTLNGAPIALKTYEMSRSFAIHPDLRRFVLGADWSIYALDSEGNQLWRHPTPSVAWAVNISGDGRLVVAAHSDGTIRWSRMDDGRELLALQVLSDKKNWVAWTPEGFYAATPGAYGVLAWHVNRGNQAAADVVRVSSIPKLRHPDALPFVLQELETARALGIADLAAARYEVQLATGTDVAPGARLHVLAIGVDDYGEKAKNLRLKFAAKDANDVASALLATQGADTHKKGGLYAQVLAQYLQDGEADRSGIFRAFRTIRDNMAKDEGQDLAVIFFSGHGATIDGRFYLLPYGVDARSLADLPDSAISAGDFSERVADLAKVGRVLVLLDACHSGAVAGDGVSLAPNAGLLLNTVSAGRLAVLTSSDKGEVSSEDEQWGHGAFTKVLLDALGNEADDSEGGLISMTGLTHYISTHVVELTGGKQHPGVADLFEGNVFAVGQ